MGSEMCIRDSLYRTPPLLGDVSPAGPAASRRRGKAVSSRRRPAPKRPGLRGVFTPNRAVRGGRNCDSDAKKYGKVTLGKRPELSKLFRDTAFVADQSQRRILAVGRRQHESARTAEICQVGWRALAAICSEVRFRLRGDGPFCGPKFEKSTAILPSFRPIRNEGVEGYDPFGLTQGHSGRNVQLQAKVAPPFGGLVAALKMRDIHSSQSGEAVIQDARHAAASSPSRRSVKHLALPPAFMNSVNACGFTS